MTGYDNTKQDDDTDKGYIPRLENNQHPQLTAALGLLGRRAIDSVHDDRILVVWYY